MPRRGYKLDQIEAAFRPASEISEGRIVEVSDQKSPYYQQAARVGLPYTSDCGDAWHVHMSTGGTRVFRAWQFTPLRTA